MQEQDATHVLLDVVFEKFPTKLEDLCYWKKECRKALEKGSFSVLDESLHKFQPIGASGFWLLSESHLSFHTWPEQNRVFVDLFSCGDEKRTEITVNELVGIFEKLGGNVERREEFKRGYVYVKED